MLLIRGSAGGTTLTGTLYERGERPPSFKGAPDEGAPYVWVCDSFYEVESGGQAQRIGGRELNVAFESPMPRGFETREAAVDAAEEHVRTQFARLGVDSGEVDIEVVEDAELADADPDAEFVGPASEDSTDGSDEHGSADAGNTDDPDAA